MRPSPPPAIASDRPTDLAESDLAKPDLAECGWRITEVYQPDGTIAYVNIPLAENRELAEENQVLARAKQKLNNGRRRWLLCWPVISNSLAT